MTTLADYRMPRWMRRTFAPLVRIICTDDAERLALVEPTIHGVELTMRTLPAFLRVSLVAGAWVFEHAALLLPSSRLSRFSALPRARQEAYFRAFWDSPVAAFHQLAKGLKATIAFSYWDQPKVLESLAYHPDRWIAEAAAKRLSAFAQDIRHHDELVVAPNPLLPLGRLGKKVDDGKAA